MHLLDKMAENSQRIGNKRVLADDSCPKGLTYEQVYTLSGRVYRYLKDHGIGKEDFVLILLPRSLQTIVCFWGVVRNGSAFVLLEDNYAPERIASIKKDCNAKIVIDSDVWMEIHKYEPLQGFEPWDDHAAAFAVYTSGTTGSPKGVVHEYGNLDRMCLSMMSEHPSIVESDRFALVAPLNFVASYLICAYAAYCGCCVDIVPYSVVKNPAEMGIFLVKHKITGLFMSPSLLRKMTAKPPMLKYVDIGSEPANGIFYEGLDIHNYYVMSESGFVVCHMLLDKPYEFTPVGVSDFNHPIYLLDEDGKEVPDGESGELCFENKFVRGYLNLPEENERVFRNGLYHTGDLARKDDQGRFIICGRLYDMVKINGNRVEPGEIENVLRKVLHIDWTAVRIFSEKDRVFIAAYYLDKDLKVDFEATRKELEKYLPYYMLPSYFIQIDAIPLRPNGKMDRKALPRPEVEDYRKDYVAARDEYEEKLCNAFSEVLGVQNVSIHDDFYLLGGDSLSSMDVLVKSKIHGLSSSDIFAGHTPERIIALWRERYPNGECESDDILDDTAMSKSHALTEYQRFMVDNQLYTPMSTMLNLFTMLQFDKEQFDPNRMAQAIEKAIGNHPSMMTRFFFNADGEIRQQYDASYAPHITVEKISTGEFRSLKDTLVRPFKIIESPLYRVRVFETFKAGYIFMDIHHTVFDGTSFKILMQDIIKAYYDLNLERDYYYLSVQEQEDAPGTPRYAEAQKYFTSVYGGDFWSTRPETDHETRENSLAHLSVDLSQNEEAMNDMEQALGITRNVFFAAVSMLSIALYNRRPDIKITWTYNGRDDVKKISSVGLLLRDLPLAARFKKNMILTDLYHDIQNQIAKGIEYCCYPYTIKGAEGNSEGLACFLFQDDIWDGGLSDELKIETVDIHQNAPAAENILDIEILDGSSGLSLTLDYSSTKYEASSMEQFGEIYAALTRELLMHFREENYTVLKALRVVQKQLKKRKFNIFWLK